MTPDNTPYISSKGPKTTTKTANANTKRSKRCRSENEKTQACRKALLAEAIGWSLHHSHARLTKWDVNHIAHDLFEYQRPLVKAGSPAGRSSGSTLSSTSTSDSTLTPRSYDTWPNASSYISEEDAHSQRSNSITVGRKSLPYTRIVSLDGLPSVEDVERLATRYGQASHMGLLDPSYNVFVNGE